MKIHSISTTAQARFAALYRIGAPVLVAIAVIWRTLNLFLYYESDIGYYRTGAVMPTAFRIFLLLGTLFFAVCALTFDKKAAPMPQRNGAIAIVSFAVGACFAITALLRYCLSATAMSTGTIFAFVTGGLAAVYFILYGCKKLSAVAAVLTGLGAILWFASVLSASYLDLTVTMNAPLKLVLHLACLGGMMLILAEMRMICQSHKKRLYLFALATGTLYLCTSAIPTLIAQLAGILGECEIDYVNFVCLALGLFGLIRLLCPFYSESVRVEETDAERIELPDGQASEGNDEVGA